MKRLAILGSTGSIGQSALEVVAKAPENSFEVEALAARSDFETLTKQILRFKPRLAALADPEAAAELRRRFPLLEILEGDKGVMEIATLGSDITLAAMSGTAGLAPALAAAASGKRLALANKEALVSGGALFMECIRKSGTELIPVDSEHSALFQLIDPKKSDEVRRLILTASGGPFREYTPEQLSRITPQSALRHPTWAMGAKITIDSSTLMNKGLEVIEAHWLFEMPLDKIDVVIHPQSIIHSMVEMRDGTLLAHMSEPSMQLPIQYALTYPARGNAPLPRLDFSSPRTLSFSPPDHSRFPALNLARHALLAGGSAPCYLNAANELLVHRFLNREISWTAISLLLEKLLDSHTPRPIHSLEELLEIDAAARCDAAALQTDLLASSTLP